MRGSLTYFRSPPSAFLHSYQPTCAERVQLLRYWPRPGLSPGFADDQDRRAFPPAVRVHVAQHRPEGNGSKRALQISAPCATWRALLEAPRDGVLAGIGVPASATCVCWRGIGGPPLVLHAEGGGLFPVSHGRLEMRRQKVCANDFTPGRLAVLQRATPSGLNAVSVARWPRSASSSGRLRRPRNLLLSSLAPLDYLLV
jgi:hypothetical protein